MVQKIIKLQDVSQVQAFNAACMQAPFGIDIRQGKYLIDAKSIMGIFSLDLSVPLTLEADTDDEAAVQERFGPYVVKD